MTLFRISWQTPEGEQTEWSHFASADGALREANARENAAMMTDQAIRSYLNSLNQARPMIVVKNHHPRPKSLLGSLFGEILD